MQKKVTGNRRAEILAEKFSLASRKKTIKSYVLKSSVQLSNCTSFKCVETDRVSVLNNETIIFTNLVTSYHII